MIAKSDCKHLGLPRISLDFEEPKFIFYVKTMRLLVVSICID